MDVKQLAKKCGVSEQAIRLFCAKNNFRKIGGRWNPTKAEADMAALYYAAKTQDVLDENESQNESLFDEDASKKSSSASNESQNATSESHETSNESASVDNEDIIDVLHKELSLLQKQLEVKDNQIEQLQHTVNELLDTNKALAASTALNTAADKKDVLLSEATVIEEPREQKKKKSFWASLFGD